MSVSTNYWLHNVNLQLAHWLVLCMTTMITLKWCRQAGGFFNFCQEVESVRICRTKSSKLSHESLGIKPVNTAEINLTPEAAVKILSGAASGDQHTCIQLSNQSALDLREAGEDTTSRQTSERLSNTVFLWRCPTSCPLSDFKQTSCVTLCFSLLRRLLH